MHVTNRGWDEVWKCEMKNVISCNVLRGRLWVHHEADKNSMNLCQLIPTHYMKKDSIDNALKPFKHGVCYTNLRVFQMN